MNENEQYADAVLIRSIDLQALTTGLLIDYLAKLEKLQRDLVALLAFHDPTAPGAGDPEELVAQVRAKITETYAELRNRIEDDFAEIEQIQEEFERDALALFFGIVVAATTVAAFSRPSLTVLGLTIAETLERQSAELEFRAVGSIRRGIGAGDTLPSLIDRIRGTDAPGMDLEVRAIDPSRRSLEIFTRTAVEAAATRARERTAAAALPEVEEDTTPPPSVKPPTVIRYGWQQISVLDARTSQICRDYAFKIWNSKFEPIGHKLPYNEGVPRHPYCRSSIVMILLDGDPVRDMSFAQWMNRQAEERKREIFGSKAYALYLAGKLDASGLLRSKERQLTFDDLRKRAP